MTTRLIALIKGKNEREERERVNKNNLELRIATLRERISETEKITTNENPQNIPGMLFQILENQEHIMESLVNIQTNILLNNKQKK